MPSFIERRAQSRVITKDIVVLYHGACSDGFGGAWAVWKKFGDRAEYIGVEDHNVLPAGVIGKEVYLVDFMYNESALRELMANNPRVTGIDHHVSSKELTLTTHQPSYALEHSGAVLAWQYFHPDQPIPELLLMIEDMDLWKFARPHTKELFAYLDTYNFDFKEWDQVADALQESATKARALEAGVLLLKHEDKLIEGLIATHSQLVLFEGHEVYAINSPFFKSPLGNMLCKRRPPLAIVWYVKDGLVCVSLRSDGTADVAKIAQKYGGGGHAASAGFTLPSLDAIPWKPI